MTAHGTVRPLFGDEPIQEVSEIFDELGLTILALEAQADYLTTEDFWIDADAGRIVREGTTLAVIVSRVRQLQELGLHLALRAKRETLHAV